MLITREAQVIKKYETGKRVCDIKRFKRTELNYILITHYTFIKKNEIRFYAANPKGSSSRNMNNGK